MRGNLIFERSHYGKIHFTRTEQYLQLPKLRAEHVTQVSVDTGTLYAGNKNCLRVD